MSAARQRGSRKSTVPRLDDETQLQKVMRHSTEDPWSPSVTTAWKLLLSARLCSALWSGISDCDETYNYWEPVHHLVYGQGLQTWEYDPRFALRSYLYLIVYSVPAWIYSTVFQPSPILVFFFVRLVLACVSSSVEVYFYTGVIREFGHNVGRLTLGVMCLCPGMFISGTAFLPSSTSMYLTFLAYGAWFQKHFRIAIFCTALSVLLSWPFTALLGIPIAVDILLIQRRTKLFLSWSSISAACILLPMITCDSFFYGKLVFASLNIVTYNVFTDHGPDLYGTEPASYYLLNGLLNFNLIFVAALVCFPIFLLSQLVNGNGKGKICILFQIGLYLWLAVFWTRPHKEERFLFPVYPLIMLAGSLTVHSCQRIVAQIFNIHVKNAWLLSGLVLFIFGILSFARVAALYQHYHGSMQVWMKVAEMERVPRQTAYVCVGKEWHRFPSSFFLPSTSYRLGFLQSEFKGQLPKYYSEASNGTLLTDLIHEDFNDLNQEEISRYINLDKCKYIVDLDNKAVTSRQPRYSELSGWKHVAEFPFLDSSSCHPLFRAFYVPLFSSQKCKYNRYELLSRSRRPTAKLSTKN